MISALSEAPPVRPFDALVALSKLMRDPEKTEHAFEVVQALEGIHAPRMVARFRASPSGARMLAERRSLLSVLCDRDALLEMPEGSLGRAYLAFCEREGITPGGLVEASTGHDRDRLPADLRYVADRMRDSHDLWHVLTGYRTDLVGENSVLAFTAAQSGSVGVGLLASGGYLRSLRLPRERGAAHRALVRGAWLRGRRAAWLPAVPLEDLLPRPLDEVRAGLRIDDPPEYSPIYTAELDAILAAA